MHLSKKKKNMNLIRAILGYNFDFFKTRLKFYFKKCFWEKKINIRLFKK